MRVADLTDWLPATTTVEVRDQPPFSRESRRAPSADQVLDKRCPTPTKLEKLTESVEVSSDARSSDRMEDGDAEAGDDGAVREQTEGNERVTSSVALPEDESDGTETSDDEESDAVG